MIYFPASSSSAFLFSSFFPFPFLSFSGEHKILLLEEIVCEVSLNRLWEDF